VSFSIRDREDLASLRKDSLSEFSLKRARTLSEAVDDISVSAVDSLVIQMIEKEFVVLQKGCKEEGNE